MYKNLEYETIWQIKFVLDTIILLLTPISHLLTHPSSVDPLTNLTTRTYSFK